jgi:mRNA interferase MazF
MAVTSQIKSTAIIGETTIVNWKAAGLLKPSVIKPVIATIEQTLVRKILGHLDEIDQISLQSMLRNILGNTA